MPTKPQLDVLGRHLADSGYIVGGDYTVESQ